MFGLLFYFFNIFIWSVAMKLKSSNFVKNNVTSYGNKEMSQSHFLLYRMVDLLFEEIIQRTAYKDLHDPSSICTIMKWPIEPVNIINAHRFCYLELVTAVNMVIIIIFLLNETYHQFQMLGKLGVFQRFLFHLHINVVSPPSPQLLLSCQRSSSWRLVAHVSCYFSPCLIFAAVWDVLRIN